MYYSRQELKAMARTQLSGKWSTYIGAAVLIYVVESICQSVLSFLTNQESIYRSLNTQFGTRQIVLFSEFILGSFLVALIMAVVQIGFLKMFLDGSRGYPVRFNDLFYGFRHHPDRIILMQLLLGLISIGVMLPGYIFLIAAIVADNAATIPLLVSCILLFLIGIGASIYLTLAYSQAMFLMTDYDDIGPVQALRESRRLMQGHKGRYFVLELSFLGVYLLGVLSCGIGLLWVTPYMNMTLCNFYREVTGELSASPAQETAQNTTYNS